MGFLDEVLKAVQKPQGMLVGGLTGLGNQVSKGLGFNVNQSGLQALGLQKDRDEEDVEELNNIFRDLDEQGVDTTPFEHLRPRAQTALSGIKEGWQGKISPGEVYRQGQDVDKWETDGNLLDKVLKPAFDITVDPLMVAGASGGLSKLAGGLAQGGKVAQQVGRGVEGVGTFGNLANAGIEGSRGAMAASKAGQFARRGYQGLLATGDPMSAIGAGFLLGGAEKIATSPLAKAAAGRLGSLGRRGAANAVEESSEIRVPSNSNGPLALNAGPRVHAVGTPEPLFDDFTVSQAFKQGAGAARPDLTDVMLESKALPRGVPTTGRAFEAGPVGSTGAEGLTDPIKELLQRGPKALPPAFGTSGGFPMGVAKTKQEELLAVLQDFLRKEGYYR